MCSISFHSLLLDRLLGHVSSLCEKMAETDVGPATSPCRSACCNMDKMLELADVARIARWPRLRLAASRRRALRTRVLHLHWCVGVDDY